MSFEFTKLAKSDLEYPIIIQKTSYADERGSFEETYKYSEFKLNNINISFIQDNLSYSNKGVVRGLHYQTNPKAQAKLCSVLQGKVLDFAVDIRKESSTFGKVFSVELSLENKKMFYVPIGFAHGFITLEDDTIFSYKCSDEYSKENEAGIRYDDPELELRLNRFGLDLIVSSKDLELPYLGKAKLF